jgi:2-polyprenyl-6-methoxyphenol hydroxylase-like FAD-dependent oxidoreductase
LIRVDEGLNLHFDNRLYKFDMIVGADGAWSKVRPFLSKHQPTFTGFSGYKFTISSVEERYPDLHKLVNRGSFFAFSDKRLIMAQYMGDNSLDVAEWALRDEAWRDAQDGNIKAVKAMIAKEYHDWAPELVKLTQVADDEPVVARSLYMLPVDHHWENRPGVTLIGDAAHLITPLGGQGVNIAMADATKLAHAIIEAERVGGLATKVKAFELDMFQRANQVAVYSDENLKDMMLNEGAPRSVIERYVARAMSLGKPRFVAIGISISVHIYYWLWKLIN